MSKEHDDKPHSLAERLLASVAACRAPSTPSERGTIRTFPLELAEEAAAALSAPSHARRNVGLTEQERALLALKTPAELIELLESAREARDNAEGQANALRGKLCAPSHDGLKSRDWTEDADHENGKYSCFCVSCENAFIGHKRRVTCKLCASAPSNERENIGDLKLWQEFLEWNRAQPEPLVNIGSEYAVAQVVMRLASTPSTTPQKGETPRTDAAYQAMLDSDCLPTCNSIAHAELCPIVNGDTVMAEFAKQLERELAVVRDVLRRSDEENDELREENAAISSPSAIEHIARPRDEWHEDMGNVIWWKLPVNEPPWVGTPLDTDWINDGFEEYYTHFTPLVIPANARSDGTTEAKS